MRNLFYMAKPSYGGWVSFTSHLYHKFNFQLYKVGKRTETLKNGKPRLRNFGYNVFYQNISKENVKNINNILITAIDKHFYQYLEYFPDKTSIVIHDPTEVKGKSCQQLIDNLSRFNVITIRETVQKYLKDVLNISSIYLPHPFYPYHKTISPKLSTVATSRIDFDKHTDIILKTNQLLPSDKKIDIYGAKNDLYVYHHLTNKLNLSLENYKGTFEKSFEMLNDILSPAKFVVDLSAIRYDGGGTQYTFLEAIYQDCILILNSKWVKFGVNETIPNSPFKEGFNCLLVSNEEDLSNILRQKLNFDKLRKNARKILEPHLNVDWN